MLFKKEITFVKDSTKREASQSPSDKANLPWFPSLMAFEHYDCGRTHLFPKADFGGSLAGSNKVLMKYSLAEYPTPYNVVYLGPDEAFVYGGGYGDVQGGTGAFVSKMDPDNNRIFALDAGVGQICALELRDDSMEVIWAERQPTSEFLTLIGPQENRVVVGTAVPRGQLPTYNKEDYVVWRAASSGRELARTPEALPAINTGTMVEPYYDGQMYYLAQKGQIIELTVQPDGP